MKPHGSGNMIGRGHFRVGGPERKPKTVKDLTCIPARCPITECPVRCEHPIGAGWLLCHLIHEHRFEMGRHICEVVAGERKEFPFNPLEPPFHLCTCCAIFLYAGPDGKEETLPGNVPICHKNKFLFGREIVSVASHLVVMLMVCKTTWANTFGVHEPVDPLQIIYVFWCVCPEILKPLHCTITLSDQERKQSRGKTMNVRCVLDTPDPTEFVRKGLDILVLTQPEMESLTTADQKLIHLEISLNQYAV